MPSVVSEGGTIEYDYNTQEYYVNKGTTNIWMGDTIQNRICRGFVRFDITQLIGKEILGVVLTTNYPGRIDGDPSIFDPLVVNVLDFGNRSIEPSDFSSIGTVVGPQIKSSEPSLIYIEDPKLTQILQKKANDSMQRLHFRFQFTGTLNDNDYTFDGWGYALEDIVLRVEYVE